MSGAAMDGWRVGVVVALLLLSPFAHADDDTPTGTLVINGTKGSSKVFVGGQELQPGETISSLVEVGTYEIVVSLVDGRTYTKKVVVVPDKVTEVVFPLDELNQAKLLVELLDAKGAGLVAEVSVDGAVVGTTPWEGSVLAGTHHVMVQGSDGIGTKHVVVLPGTSETASFAVDQLLWKYRVLLGAIFMLVPEGAFVMGPKTTKGDKQWWGKKAKEPREIWLSAFYIMQFEVTMEEYQGYLDAHKEVLELAWNDPYGPKLPIANVSWFDADNYCTWLGARLCTDAEWEKAARGVDGRTYSWGNKAPTCDDAVFNWDVDASPAVFCSGTVMDVGSLPNDQSPYGCFDMVGNVSEWVADWYDAGYFATMPATDPKGPASGFEKVIRGGNYLESAYNLVLSHREYMQPVNSQPYVGFRCCLDAD